MGSIRLFVMERIFIGNIIIFNVNILVFDDNSIVFNGKFYLSLKRESYSLKEYHEQLFYLILEKIVLFIKIQKWKVCCQL